MNDTATATARMLEGNLRAFAAHVSAPDDVLDAPRMAELYAYAAECVKRVPELEAEVARLLEAMYDATLSLSNHPCGEAGCVASLDAIHTALRHAAGLGWVVVDEAGNLRYSTRSRAAADLFARRGGWKVTYAAATREGTSDGN